MAMASGGGTGFGSGGGGGGGFGGGIDTGGGGFGESTGEGGFGGGIDTGGGGFDESTSEGEFGGDQDLSPLHCGICYEKYNRELKIPKMLNCGHTFCDECIISMIKINRLKCPTCRRVPIASQNGFPTNFSVLDMIDADKTRAKKKEETRAKSFKYYCSDCSEGLTIDTALMCELERDHTGVICIKCYSTNHSDHGGINSLKVLVHKYRPNFDRALVRVKGKYEEYKAMESYFNQRQIASTVGSLINRLISINESVTPSVDSLRTEMDEFKQVLDEGDSCLLEKLIISQRIRSFAADSFENAKCYRDLESLRDTFSDLEEILSEERVESRKTLYNSSSPSHTLRPYLELSEPITDGNGSGNYTHGTGIAGTSSSTTTAPFTPQYFQLVQGGGEWTSEVGMMGAAASSSFQRGLGGIGRGRAVEKE